MRKVALVAVSMLALVACQPLEHMEGAVAKVHFDKATSTVHTDVTFQNVSAEFFACNVDEPAAACVDHIRAYLAEKPGESATNVQVHLVRRDQQVDVVGAWDDPATGDDCTYPMVSGVSVEKHGLFRRTELVVDLDPARTVDGLDAIPHTVRPKGPGDDDHPKAVLGRGVVDVTTHTKVDDAVIPLLTAIPGLDQALADAKLW